MNIDWMLDGTLGASGMIRSGDLPLLEEHGIGAVLSLTLRSPFPDGPPDGIDHVHVPVPDMSCPSPEDLSRAVAFLDDQLSRGRKALVHCGAGYGRTGTVIACFLVTRGRSPDEAVAEVRRARPGSIETADQERGIDAFARRRKGGIDG